LPIGQEGGGVLDGMGILKVKRPELLPAAEF
jgi:hypothetical protein